MATWTRIGAAALAMVLSAGVTAYTADGQSNKGKSGQTETLATTGDKSKQVIVLTASVDRANDNVTLRGMNFGQSAPMVYCETHPLTVLQATDTELVVWFPGSVPQGTYLFSVVRGRGTSELDRNVFYVTAPPLMTDVQGPPGPQGPQGEPGPMGPEGPA
ncbi:MAG: hypothetical protein WBC51_03265, partial [Vicinamibacterales bacterium]